MKSTKNSDNLKIIKATKCKYELTLSEFPIFILSNNTSRNLPSINYEDSITGRDHRQIKRHWTVFPDEKYGFGTASTMLTFFDLLQIWSEANFESQYIYFGSIFNLLKRRGNNFGRKQYNQIKNDLFSLLGIRFSAKNAYWDNVAKAYVDVILFRLFDQLEIVKLKTGGKNITPVWRIKASDLLFKSIQNNSYYSTTFDSDFFHRLSPMGRRFSIYLSKVFLSQSVHKRNLMEFARQMPIMAKETKNIRQTITQTCNNLISRGFNLLADFKFEYSSDRQTELIIFHRAGSPVVNKFNIHSKKQKLKKEQFRIDCLTEDILDICQDDKSKNFYQRVADLMPDEDIYQAISEVKEVRDSGHVKKSLGAVFTSRILKFAGQRGIILR